MDQLGKHSVCRLLQQTARIALLLVLGAVVSLGLLVSCQSNLIYMPRAYAPGVTSQWQKLYAGQPIDFTTSQGSQRAFLQGNLKSPRKLWIVCGGNGSLALDWSDWLAAHAPKQDAWLLVDFPGYGDCQGSPNPARIRENLLACVPLACRQLGWPDRPDPNKMRFFGHSLGSAACLIAATEFKIQRGVLIAPFTSTMDMTRVITGLPLGFLVWHRFDNSARLAELAASGPGQVIILHGTRDEIIPVAMGRSLAARQPAIVNLREIPDGSHNTIHQLYADQVEAALIDARQ